jgi:regulatory protein
LGLMSEAGDGQSEHAKAKVAALRLLARRARTRADLATRLRRRGFARTAVEAVLEELGGAGYVDDEAYAQERIDELLRGSKYGAPGLVEKLVKDGIDPDLAERSAAERLRDVNEREWARQVAARRLAEMPELDAETKRRRLHGYLSRRGFSGEDIIAALEEVLPREP